jgi:hypothetical protein
MWLSGSRVLDGDPFNHVRVQAFTVGVIPIHTASPLIAPVPEDLTHRSSVNAPLASTLGVPPHPDEDRPQRPILLTVDRPILATHRDRARRLGASRPMEQAE